MGPLAEDGHLSRLFAVDTRALAALRMALAALLLFDLAQRSFDLAAFCTDDGVMTVEDARRWAGTPLRWSLHAVSGGLTWQIVLFAVAGVFAGMLAAGYRTRLATVASWVLLISLHARTPLVTTGGDLLLRMLLFWGMFLPLGLRWSIDAAIQRRHDDGFVLPPQVLSVGTAAILLQVAVVYFFSGLHKWNDIWLGGEALSRIFANEMWSRPLGRALLEFPALLAGLTWATLALELVAPVALFSPRKTEIVRIATVSALVLMHLFIELTMSVGLFSYVALAGLLLFLPPRVWSTLCRERPPWRSADAIHCPSWRSAGAILCGLFLFYVVLWNLADSRLFGGRLAPLMPRPLWHFARATSIDQRWTMFAEPPAAGGWFTAEARLRDGRVVDLLRGGQRASDDPPPHPTGDFRNPRWQKLFANLLEPHLVEHRAGVAEYLARQWNRLRGPTEHVVVLDLYFFERHHPRRDEGVVIARHTIARVELGRPEETDAFSELLDRLDGL